MTRFSRLSSPCLSLAESDCHTRSNILILCLAVVLSAATTSPLSADQWTDVSGEKTIEAKFVGVMGERAILELPSGQRSAVALRDLQYESRQRALDMESARQDHMATLSSELARAAEEERELAPKRIPPPESASEYKPIPEKASLEETVEHTTRQLLAGHFRTYWDALPPSHQADIEEVVAEFAEQMDPVVWQETLGSVNRITELLASRERWVFSHPLIEKIGADETVRDGYRAILGAVQTVFDPDVMTLDRLKEGNLEELIAERDALLAGYFRSAASSDQWTSEMEPSQFKVKMIDDTRGTVTYEPLVAGDGPDQEGSTRRTPSQGSPFPWPGSKSQNPGKPQTFVLVEGRWIPEDLAKQWEQQVKTLKEKIKNELPDQLAALRPKLEKLKEGIEQYIGPLEEADSEAEFHAGIDQVAFRGVGLVMSASGGMNRRNRSGGGSFGSAMGMEDYGRTMEMEAMDMEAAGEEMVPPGEEGDVGSMESEMEIAP